MWKKDGRMPESKNTPRFTQHNAKKLQIGKFQAMIASMDSALKYL